MQKNVQIELNYDINTYEFDDLDLEISVKSLPARDQKILILYLMGYNHDDIARLFNLTDSMISKRLKKIRETLSLLMS